MAAKQMMGIIAGVDEVGRGPLAGPVIAAAVIIERLAIPKGTADSKMVPAAKREALYELICKNAQSFALGRAEVDEIDAINIHHASLLAMRRAVEALVVVPEIVWVDGKFCPQLSMPVEAIVQGDVWVPIISAASIIAKVTRDREMIALDKEFPGYGFAQHKGYSTPGHLAALQSLGPCCHHRRSFSPVRDAQARKNAVLDIVLVGDLEHREE